MVIFVKPKGSAANKSDNFELCMCKLEHIVQQNVWKLRIIWLVNLHAIKVPRPSKCGTGRQCCSLRAKRPSLADAVKVVCLFIIVVHSGSTRRHIVRSYTSTFLRVVKSPFHGIRLDPEPGAVRRLVPSTQLFSPPAQFWRRTAFREEIPLGEGSGGGRQWGFLPPSFRFKRL